MTNDRDAWSVKAGPTKDFFIEMLVKDIPLEKAIIDLVDNSVDGAIRLSGGGPYDGLEVRIEITADSITIRDNCGGIPVNVARKYAFRFGRPEDFQLTLGSVGHVGVGMKRAFFKLGNMFRVESTTETSHFVVEEDVNEWRASDEWEFQFDELDENLRDTAVEERGTIVTVTKLHESVSKSFRDNSFEVLLHRELAAAHKVRVKQGLRITLNGIPVDIEPMELLQSEVINPAYREMILGALDPLPVRVIIYAGIARSSPSQAGWYVFCNGRMVLEADKTTKTGWGEGEGRKIPSFHNQFAMFRGYVFFDCDDARMLPWNTTKTSVDMDSPGYRAVRLEMMKLMRPVVDFLNRLAGEKDLETDDQPLTHAVNVASSQEIANVETAETFMSPKPVARPPLPRKGRIQYSKPVSEIDRTKKELRVSTYREVGERTFEYFFERECED